MLFRVYLIIVKGSFRKYIYTCIYPLISNESDISKILYMTEALPFLKRMKSQIPINFEQIGRTAAIIIHSNEKLFYS